MKPTCIFLFFFFFSIAAFGQGNGKLQIHYMDVGQGDGAILISPQGETVLFDNGVGEKCEKPLQYLSSLGITQIDYMIISHYHADHFGCTKRVLAAYPLKKFSYDRGGKYDSSSYETYLDTVGNKRRKVDDKTTITLDAGSANAVTINIAASNGAGIDTENENDRSVVAVVHFGNFDAMMAGDLSGVDTDDYEDIESTVSKRVGQVEVYKVNHHGSRYSSNAVWLKTLSPKIAVISTGVGNKYRHPTKACLDRLHAAGITKTYWTSKGNGVTPMKGKDIVANGTVVVQFKPGDKNFTVGYKNRLSSYALWPSAYRGKR